MLIVTENIKLKPLSLEDSDMIFTIIDRERDILRKWLGFVDLVTKKEDIDRFIELSLAQNKSPQYCIYDHGRLVGLVGFKDYDEKDNKVEIGYWLSQSVQRKGLMTLSVRVLLNQAFTNMDMNQVQIKAAVENIRSRKIPERLGFTLEGIEEEGELLPNQGYIDLCLYILQKENYDPKLGLYSKKEEL